jgi:hypothetical protein
LVGWPGPPVFDVNPYSIRTCVNKAFGYEKTPRE